MALLSRFEPSLVDLEIESLLLEALQNPRARLFRATRSQAARERLERNPSVGPNSPGLLAVERKLLSSYRDEAAYLLRCLYYVFFTRDEQRKSMLSAHRGPCAPLSALDAANHAERLREIEREVTGGFFEQFLAAEIAEGASVGLRSAGRPSQLVASSVRLAPHGMGRVYHGYEAANEGDWDSVELIAGIAAETASDEETALCASSLLGLAHARRGAVHKACEIYRSTASLAPTWPNEVLSWFTSAVQSARDGDVREASELIDSGWTPEHPDVQAWISARRTERARGVWAPDPHATQRLRLAIEELGPTSRMVCYVFDP